MRTHGFRKVPEAYRKIFRKVKTYFGKPTLGGGPFLEKGAAIFARNSRKGTGSIPEGKFSFVSVCRTMAFFDYFFKP